MAEEVVIGEFTSQAQAEAAAALLEAQGFALEGITAVVPPEAAEGADAPTVAPLGQGGNILVTLQPTDRHEKARALLCQAGAVETDFSLTGDERPASGNA